MLKKKIKKIYIVLCLLKHDNNASNLGDMYINWMMSKPAYFFLPKLKVFFIIISTPTDEVTKMGILPIRRKQNE